jgi:hypothetical protein
MARPVEKTRVKVEHDPKWSFVERKERQERQVKPIKPKKELDESQVIKKLKEELLNPDTTNEKEPK